MENDLTQRIKLQCWYQSLIASLSSKHTIEWTEQQSRSTYSGNIRIRDEIFVVVVVVVGCIFWINSRMFCNLLWFYKSWWKIRKFFCPHGFWVYCELVRDCRTKSSIQNMFFLALWVVHNSALSLKASDTFRESFCRAIWLYEKSFCWRKPFKRNCWKVWIFPWQSKTHLQNIVSISYYSLRQLVTFKWEWRYSHRQCYYNYFHLITS